MVFRPKYRGTPAGYCRNTFLFLKKTSANVIKIQIWVTLIANLLLSVLQSTLQRRWNFSGLATIVRIVLMYYLNLENFFNNPEADLKRMLVEATNPPPEREEID